MTRFTFALWCLALVAFLLALPKVPPLKLDRVQWCAIGFALIALTSVVVYARALGIF